MRFIVSGARLWLPELQVYIGLLTLEILRGINITLIKASVQLLGLFGLNVVCIRVMG